MTCVDYMSDLSQTANKFDEELVIASSKFSKKQLNSSSNRNKSSCCKDNDDCSSSHNESKNCDKKLSSDAKESTSVTEETDVTNYDENILAYCDATLAEGDVASATAVPVLNQGPRHATICIDNDLTAATFESKIFGGNVQKFGIVGLHTCGDLGPNLVNRTSPKI